MLVYFVFVLGIGVATERPNEDEQRTFSSARSIRRGLRCGFYLRQPRGEEVIAWATGAHIIAPAFYWIGAIRDGLFG